MMIETRAEPATVDDGVSPGLHDGDSLTDSRIIDDDNDFQAWRGPLQRIYQGRGAHVRQLQRRQHAGQGPGRCDSYRFPTASALPEWRLHGLQQPLDLTAGEGLYIKYLLSGCRRHTVDGAVTAWQINQGFCVASSVSSTIRTSSASERACIFSITWARWISTVR